MGGVAAEQQRSQQHKNNPPQIGNHDDLPSLCNVAAIENGKRWNGLLFNNYYLFGNFKMGSAINKIRQRIHFCRQTI
jgi:hypothetical protein